LSSEEARNQNLDKLLYSLISQQEFHKNQHRYAEFQPRQPAPLKPSQSADSAYFNNCLSDNSFLGPIQRPKAAYQPNNFAHVEPNLFNFDPNSNQFSMGSSLKLTGEDIAMLSALFSAKTQEMANKSKNLAEFNNIQHQQSVSKSLLRSTKSSDDSTRFQEFRLFDNLTSSSEMSNKNSFILDNYNIESGSTGSYWPMTNDDHSPASNTEINRSKATPWNSVLLNDFDGFGGPPSLSNSSTGNHIKSLWTTASMKEGSGLGEKYAKVAAAAVVDEKQAKNLKLKKNK
jgi:hypothetical protein